jgi:hypothetical protein
MRNRGRFRRSSVLMPASALLSSNSFEERTILGVDLVAIVPTAPSRLRNVILSVAAGARKRGWNVRLVRWPM